LRKTEDDGVYPSSLIVKAVRLDRIVADPWRPRAGMADGSLDALCASLLIHGQITPIVLQYLSDDDVFVLVDGERRWRAAQKAGLKTLDAVIVGRMTPLERRERQMAANLHQYSWAADERAHAVDALGAALGASEAEAAARLGLSARDSSSLALETPAADERCLDAAGGVDQAAEALDDALTRIKRGKGNHSDVLKALDELEEMIDEHRARLACARRRVEPTKGLPVRNLPTWQ
jgi:ParB/RepB/Spo0J family partition protein